MTQTVPVSPVRVDALPRGGRARHPLAPLTVSEAAAATRLALGPRAEPSTRVVYCALEEPVKEQVLGWDGRALPREVLCVLYERPTRTTWLVTVSLSDQAVVSRVPVPGVQPPIMTEEWIGGGEQIKADPGFRAALARRGITDLSRVQVDPWPAGHFGLDVDASDVDRALVVNAAEWRQELPLIEEWFEFVGDKLPTGVRDEFEALKQRLAESD